MSNILLLILQHLDFPCIFTVKYTVLSDIQHVAMNELSTYRCRNKWGPVINVSKVNISLYL